MPQAKKAPLQPNLLHRTEVAAFFIGGFGVGYGMRRALVVAAQTHSTVLAPLWPAVSHSDVAHRAITSTTTATGASIGGVEWEGRHSVAFKPRIDNL